jgi:hypothetical protein
VKSRKENPNKVVNQSSWFNLIKVINPSKPLHHHGIFWLPILVFIPLALLLSFPTWCFCWPTPENYEAILKAQSFPVFIASLAIPFTVVINRFHSSSQRAEANRLALQNMTFNQYFDHRTQFYKFTESVSLGEPFCNFITINNPDALYTIIFPLNKIDHQNMSAPSDEVSAIIKRRIHYLSKHLNHIIKEYVKNGRVNNFDSIRFLIKLGKPFGVSFSKDIIDYVNSSGDKNTKSVLDLCFCGFREVVLMAGGFSHIGMGGWTTIMAFSELLNSTQNNNNFDLFVSYLENELHILKNKSPRL